MTIETKPELAQWRQPECATIAVRAAAGLLALSAFVFACIAATAQTGGPDAPSSAPTSTPAPSEPQGFFDAFGNWVQQGVANAGAGVAAAALCRAKGYVGGTSVDFETVEKCPPPYRVSGRNTPEGVCTMEHFVT